MKKKLSIVLFVLIAIIAVSAIIITKTNSSDKPGPNVGDSETAKAYVENLANNTNLDINPVYKESFDEGCETSPSGSGFVPKTDKRCTYRHIIVYSVPNQAVLNELNTKILQDNWTGNGQNVISDTDYFRSNGATYYRYDGPLTKNSTLSVNYYGKDSGRNIDHDISLANSYDSGKLDSLATVKSKLATSAEGIAIVDIKYEYYLNLY